MVEPLAVTIFSIVGGWLSDRAGTRDPSVAGLITTGSALLLFSVGSNIDSSALYVVILLGAIGAGIGFFAPSNTNAALSSVLADRRGVTNGILGMMRHSGQSISLALGTAFIGYYIFGQGTILGEDLQSTAVHWRAASQFPDRGASGTHRSSHRVERGKTRKTRTIYSDDSG